MKTAAAIFGALAVTFFAGTAFAADSSDRTSMPSSCSERDANCVIQDGPPRRRNGTLIETTPPTGRKGTTAQGSKPGTTKPGDSRDSTR
jgi:hypothetical protein